jgi:UDP-N-acetylmuramoyl-tripeptide--D-alanyl-D-alanine ligase
MVGVPLTLLELGADDDFLVAELGADRPGEIARLTELVRPEIGVITAIAPVHLERLGTLESVAREKSALVAGLCSGAPVAVLPGDSEWTPYLRSRAAGRVVTFGCCADADIGAEEIALDDAGLPRFVLRRGGERRACRLAIPGRAPVGNALAAAAVGLAAGVPLDGTIEALEAYAGMNGRGRVHRLARRDALLLDSAYNASPASVAAALETLSALAARRRVAILGDRLELGADAARFHREAGEAAARHRVDVLICVGPLSAATADAAGRAGVADVHHVASTAEAIRLVDRTLAEGDAVLVKGSHAVGLEQLVEHLKGGPQGN